MSLENSAKSADPILISFVELVEQDARVLEAYAAHYNLPMGLTKSKILQRIVDMQDGPPETPAIPVLPRFTINRVDGRVQLSLSETSPSEGTLENTEEPLELPAYRRLRRDPVPPVGDEGDIPRKVPLSSTSSKEESFSPIAPASPPQRSLPEFELDPEIMLRFPTPCDTFSPSPSPPLADRPLGRLSVESTAIPKPKMKFVYPPIPRTPPPGQCDDPEGAERAFSPGDCWLRKMLYDLERDRKQLCDDLEDAKHEVSEALTEVTKAELACKQEIKETQGFVKQLQKVVGPDFLQSLIASIEEEDKEENPDEDHPDEDDGEAEDGGETDEDDNDPDEDDVNDTPNEEEEEEEECDADIQDKGNVGENTPISRPPSLLPPFKLVIGDEEPESSSRRSSSPQQFIPIARKRARTPDDLAEDKEDISRPKRSKLRHDAPPTNRDVSPPLVAPQSIHSSPIASPFTSPSRKRARDDAGDASEEEVEISVRALGPASSSGMWKRQRSDSNCSRHDEDHDGSAPATPTTRVSHFPDEEPRTVFAGDGEKDRSSGSLKPEQPFEGEEEDEEDPHAEQSGTVVLFNDPTVGRSDEDHEEDGYAEEHDYFSQEILELRRHFGLDSPHHEDGPANTDGAVVLAAEAGAVTVKAVNALWRPSRRRGLRRDKQRLRETETGEVETIVYDEIPEYRERLAHHEKTLAAWRKVREKKVEERKGK